MSYKKARAIALHDKGCNCAQVVACVFAEDLGRDEKTVYEIMESFGFGMGTMGTCGAVSAMAAVVGMNKSDGNMETPKTKKDCYADMKVLTKKFQEKNGSVICREIKGVDTGVVLRSCQGCIEDAVEFLEEYLG
ncbi:MAG: C_GCAxxG_C_C family protein [Eubacterium sp.]|nr:C_GCAxxG_C_C family protein [Candidatus Colimonas fimequi]